jgi:hypothetical protein
LLLLLATHLSLKRKARADSAMITGNRLRAARRLRLRAAPSSKTSITLLDAEAPPFRLTFGQVPPNRKTVIHRVKGEDSVERTPWKIRAHWCRPGCDD